MLHRHVSHESSVPSLMAMDSRLVWRQAKSGSKMTSLDGGSGIVYLVQTSSARPNVESERVVEILTSHPRLILNAPECSPNEPRPKDRVVAVDSRPAIRASTQPFIISVMVGLGRPLIIFFSVSKGIRIARAYIDYPRVLIARSFQW